MRLNKSELNNLKIFLSRTNLTGAEVTAYCEIIKAIYEAETKHNEPTKEGDVIE